MKFLVFILLIIYIISFTYEAEKLSTKNHRLLSKKYKKLQLKQQVEQDLSSNNKSQDTKNESPKQQSEDDSSLSSSSSSSSSDSDEVGEIPTSPSSSDSEEVGEIPSLEVPKTPSFEEPEINCKVDPIPEENKEFCEQKSILELQQSNSGGDACDSDDCDEHACDSDDCDEPEIIKPKKKVSEQEMMLFYHEKENRELDEYDCDLIRDKEKRDQCFESKMSLDDDDESSSTSSSSSCDEQYFMRLSQVDQLTKLEREQKDILNHLKLREQNIVIKNNRRIKK